MTTHEDAAAMLRQYAAHVLSGDVSSPWTEWEIEHTADELEREEQAANAVEPDDIFDLMRGEYE